MSDPRLNGWQVYTDLSEYARLVGPVYFKEENGQKFMAFIVEKKHCNRAGFAHGGALMGFADIGLSYVSEEPGKPTASVTFTYEFARPAKLGDMVICRGEVIRQTRSLIFCHGQLVVDGTVIVNCSTVEKIPGK